MDWLRSLSNFANAAKPVVEFGTAAVGLHAAYQTARGIKKQNKALDRQASLQQQAHADAQMHKAHSEREVAWRRSQSRKRVRQSGYMAFPTGWE